ncbi:hypothetical protein ACFOYV_06505, partial [Pseudophaeobacter arcticus]|uniref:hypothetical protein n=1 Tax=Pseudophaeobacter arcticus TaxID=385492 RepID=UPI00360BEC11
EAMPKHKQAGQTTVLTKMTANTDRKRLQCRSHPQKPLARDPSAALQLPRSSRSTHCAAFLLAIGSSAGLSSPSLSANQYLL